MREWNEQVHTVTGTLSIQQFWWMVLASNPRGQYWYHVVEQSTEDTHTDCEHAGRDFREISTHTCGGHESDVLDDPEI